VILKVAGYFVPSWKNVFENLPELIKTSNWVDEYKKIMERMGLQIKLQYLTLGSSAILTGRKKI
jgi:demethylmenaquinone methyltransferase / 2-methoxy-6-polyprenyl-1,4-benzoquinol methylase